MGCGRNYRKGRTAVKAADKLNKDCAELAKVWLDIINERSIDAGYQLAKMSENKQKATLEAIASGVAKTPKQAKALIKANSPKSSSAERVKNNTNDSNGGSDRNLKPQTNPQQESAISGSAESLTNEKSLISDSVGSWVIVKIPLFPLEKTPERKWNGFWGKITEVGATLKVDMGLEVVSLLQSDVERIENPTPSFCQVAERVLRLQSFDTVHEFGKVILNRIQQTLSWDAAALAYLDAVEQIELARRAIEQAL